MKSKNHFEPFGLELPLINSTDNRIIYTGQERDTFTNYDYMHFRFYASSMGRFLQPDNIIPDITNPQNWNAYTYVKGNPVNYNDPSGHFAGGFGGGLTRQTMKQEYFAPPSGNAWEMTAVEKFTFIWTEYYSVTVTKDIQGNILSVSEPTYLYSVAGISGRCTMSPDAQKLTFTKDRIAGKNILLSIIDPSSPEDAVKVAENYQTQFYNLGANCVEIAYTLDELNKFEGYTFDLTFFFGHGMPSSGPFKFGGEYSITTSDLIIYSGFQNKSFGTTYWIGCYSQPMAYFSSHYWRSESWGFNEIIWSTKEGWIYYKPKRLVNFVP